MDQSAFNHLCQAARLPLLDARQWDALVATRQGAMLVERDADDATALPLPLELIVRSLSPMAHAALTALGYAVDVQRLLDIAEQEQVRLFAALHKSATDPLARRYLATLDFARPPATVEKAPYYSFHVYGSKGALCFSEATTRLHERATINVEGAVALTGPARQYDWRDKLIIQLSPEELFLLLAVVNGKLDQVEFAGHGARHDKVLAVERQQSHYFVRLVQRGRAPVAVPMPVLQAVNLMSLLLRQIKQNHPHLSRDDLAAMEDQLVRMHPSSTRST